MQLKEVEPVECSDAHSTRDRYYLLTTVFHFHECLPAAVSHQVWHIPHTDMFKLVFPCSVCGEVATFSYAAVPQDREQGLLCVRSSQERVCFCGLPDWHQPPSSLPSQADLPEHLNGVVRIGPPVSPARHKSGAEHNREKYKVLATWS